MLAASGASDGLRSKTQPIDKIRKVIGFIFTIILHVLRL